MQQHQVELVTDVTHHDSRNNNLWNFLASPSFLVTI